MSGRPAPFPKDHRLRLALYLALQAAVFLAPGAGILPAAAAILVLGVRAGVDWGRWLARLGPLLGVILLPALAGLPEAWPARIEVTAFLAAWSPGLRRSLAFLLVLASAEWLSRTTRVDEIRETLEGLLGPLGPRGRRAALAAALTLGFLPWARYELARADEAVRLRGSDPRRGPLRHLAALGIPLTARLLEKARLSSEALALRDADPDPAAPSGGDIFLDGTPDLGGQGRHQGPS
jgi:energy-coupling factor transporter transmembrane protein EcfT